MKKLVLIALSALVIGLVPAMADQNTYFKPGTLEAQAGVGAGWGLGIEGGVDLSLGQFSLAPTLPFDWGVGARAGFATGLLGYGGGLGLQGGAVLHYSWKSLGLSYDWLNKMESYTGLGLYFQTGNSLFPIGLAEMGGTSYHIDDKLAVEIGYYSIIGGTLGVTYKLN
jgi:hypothetical protein